MPQRQSQSANIDLLQFIHLVSDMKKPSLEKPATAFRYASIFKWTDKAFNVL